MNPGTEEIRRARDYEAIKPLVELCKAGKLFQIQEWISAGKPVNPPPIPDKGQRPKSPLDVAIERGFHSLVQVLLKAGAAIEPEGWGSPMNKALEMRRLDVVQLLVEHGYDPRTVDMDRVFDSWDPEIMTFFIERGADIETGRPLAYAFSNRIRTALRIYKQYVKQFPSLQEQANIALRHHCKEGNQKWISLMLWLGADPYKPGSDACDEEPDDEDEGLSALEYAALYDHFEIFETKQIRANPTHPYLCRTLRYMCSGRGVEMMKQLLENGLDPNDQDNGGCSAIQGCLNGMSWSFRIDPWGLERDRKNIDTERSRDGMKAIHLLVKHGARWLPVDKDEISDVRRSLLKLSPDYTAELIWIMWKYKACVLGTAEALLRTPAIKRHVSEHRKRLQEILSSWS